MAQSTVLLPRAELQLFGLREYPQPTTHDTQTQASCSCSNYCPCAFVIVLGNGCYLLLQIITLCSDKVKSIHSPRIQISTDHNMPLRLKLTASSLHIREGILIKVRGLCWWNINCTKEEMFRCHYGLFLNFQPQVIFSFFDQFY